MKVWLNYGNLANARYGRTQIRKGTSTPGFWVSDDGKASERSGRWIDSGQMLAWAMGRQYTHGRRFHVPGHAARPSGSPSPVKPANLRVRAACLALVVSGQMTDDLRTLVLSC